MPIPIEKQADILALHQMGDSSNNRIAQTLALDWKTVAKYRKSDPARFPELIQARKELFVAELATASGLAVERVAENISKVPVESSTDLRNMAWVAGVMADKHLAFQGLAPGQQSAIQIYLGLQSGASRELSPQEVEHLSSARLERLAALPPAESAPPAVDIQPSG